MKLTDAQVKKREMKVMCNRKINSFIHKYALVNSSKIFIIFQNDIPIRKNNLVDSPSIDNDSSLNLNEENMVNIIGNIYKSNYLNDDNK
jgi:hypothetical protein